jgi:hypothetical protein
MGERNGTGATDRGETALGDESNMRDPDMLHRVTEIGLLPVDPPSVADAQNYLASERDLNRLYLARGPTANAGQLLCLF